MPGFRQVSIIAGASATVGLRRRNHPQNGFQRLVRDGVDFCIRPVLNGMGDIDDGRVEAERSALRYGGFFERSGGDHAARDAARVEIGNVMQTARCARASIAERFNHNVAFHRYSLNDVKRRDLCVSRLGVAFDCQSAFGHAFF